MFHIMTQQKYLFYNSISHIIAIIKIM